MEISSAKIEARLAKLEEALQRVARQRPHRKGFAKHCDAAAYLGISREKLRRLNVAGKGPPRTEDGRYPYEGLDSYKIT
jgi:hypothetical protein